MGVVYRALQSDARRLVALKLIKSEWWGDSTQPSDRRAESRFRNEAQALAQLEHDHIVPIYDVGHAEGVVYFSMRLIEGQTLGRMVREGGPLDPRRAAAYIEPIARAVQYAHDRGILHRDLKPSNIMVDREDRPYLIDLGLCKSLEATDATSLVGRPMGTAEYMSPEQARGDRQVGHRRRRLRPGGDLCCAADRLAAVPRRHAGRRPAQGPRGRARIGPATATARSAGS